VRVSGTLHRRYTGPMRWMRQDKDDNDDGSPTAMAGDASTEAAYEASVEAVINKASRPAVEL
jgi:hypothetical protein